MEDNETTFAQLHDRVQKTIEALKSAKRVDFDGKESKEIDLFGRFKFSAVEYLVKFGLPNFFFHVTVSQRSLIQLLGTLLYPGIQPNELMLG